MENTTRRAAWSPISLYTKRLPRRQDRSSRQDASIAVRDPAFYPSDEDLSQEARVFGDCRLDEASAVLPVRWQRALPLYRFFLNLYSTPTEMPKFQLSCGLEVAGTAGKPNP